MPTWVAAPLEALPHRLLLRAAGGVPDELLAQARTRRRTGTRPGRRPQSPGTGLTGDTDDGLLTEAYLPGGLPTARAPMPRRA
ncbi:hypothetical protein [Micromonospora zamorensis]|uniref:hypothetical protein n=1 Tax=Micromonospora zamorensis TaxID=709883 RepID=UPI00339F4253